MQSTALFVDAGYLFSAGSELLLGKVHVRRELVLRDVPGLIDLLVSATSACCDGEQLRVLRTYWYDGAGHGGVPSASQIAIGDLPRVKLRLGRVSAGSQKGVDGLIILDLITLATNRAAQTVILFTGDEDLREAALHAQSFGLTLVVAGLPPTANQSQSALLLREADHVVILTADQLRNHLSRKDLTPTAASPVTDYKEESKTERPSRQVDQSVLVDDEAAEESLRRLCLGVVRDPRFGPDSPLLDEGAATARLSSRADKVLVARLSELTGQFPIDSDLLREARSICLDLAAKVRPQSEAKPDEPPVPRRAGA